MSILSPSITNALWNITVLIFHKHSLKKICAIHPEAFVALGFAKVDPQPAPLEIPGVESCLVRSTALSRGEGDQRRTSEEFRSESPYRLSSNVLSPACLSFSINVVHDSVMTRWWQERRRRRRRPIYTPFVVLLLFLTFWRLRLSVACVQEGTQTVEWPVGSAEPPSVLVFRCVCTTQNAGSLLRSPLVWF